MWKMSLATFLLLTSSLGLIVFMVYQKLFGNKISSKKAIPSSKLSSIGLSILISRLFLGRRKLQSKYIFSQKLQLIVGGCQLFKEGIFQLRLPFSRKPLVFLFKPKTVQGILKSNVNIDKPFIYEFFKPLFDKSIFLQVGQKSRERRKFLEACFHLRTLKSYIPIFDRHSKVLVSNLTHLQSSWVEITPKILSCTVDIIIETAMGISIDTQTGGKHQEYLKAIQEVEKIFILRCANPLLYPNFFFNLSTLGKRFHESVKIVKAVSNRIMNDKLEALKKSPTFEIKDETLNNDFTKAKKPEIFLEYLLKKHIKDSSYTKEEIEDEVNFNMAAGFETSSLAICFALYLLGLNENHDIQIKVHEELDGIFKGDNGRDITWEDISQMHYLECVIKESLRLYPSVPIIGRLSTEDFEAGDYLVERGSFCFICIMALHRDPESFPNPEKFDPERFSPENASKRRPFAYLPFSAGPRNCLGMKFAQLEMQTILAAVLRNFRVISKEPRDKMNVEYNVTLKNMDPLFLKFILRNFSDY